MSFVPAGAIVRKQKQLVEAFRNAGAISPAEAKIPSELGIGGGLALRILRRHAVLRETENGALYLDQPSWKALQAFRRRLASLIVGLSLLGLGWIWYLRP
jgi:hypothetical protein